MARIARDARLETRDARSRLKKRRPPYWRNIHQGLAIGYRKGEKGGVWMVRRLIGGDKYSFTTLGLADDHQDANGADVLDYKQAHTLALAKSNEPNEPTPKKAPNDYAVEDAAQDYVVYLRKHTKAASTTEAAINAHILPAFAGRRVESITKDEIETWHAGLASAPIRRRGGKTEPVSDDPEQLRKRQSSANRILTVLKAMFNKAIEDGKAEGGAPWRLVRPFKGVERGRKVFLQQDQLQRLINATHGAFRDYILTLIYTGARPGREPERIRVGDFDKDAGTVAITTGKNETKPTRDVFLTDEGRQFFERLTAGRDPDDLLLLKDDGTAWNKNHHIRPMKEAAKVARLPKGATCYSLRHSYISIALKNRMPINVVAENCGTSVKMIQEHYAKFLDDDRRKMLNAALPSFGLEPTKVRAIGSAKKPKIKPA